MGDGGVDFLRLEGDGIALHLRAGGLGLQLVEQVEFFPGGEQGVPRDLHRVELIGPAHALLECVEDHVRSPRSCCGANRLKTQCMPAVPGSRRRAWRRVRSHLIFSRNSPGPFALASHNPQARRTKWPMMTPAWQAQTSRKPTI